MPCACDVCCLVRLLMSFVVLCLLLCVFLCLCVRVCVRMCLYMCCVCVCARPWFAPLWLAVCKFVVFPLRVLVPPGMCFHLQQRGVFEQVVGNVKNKCYYVLLLGTRRCATIPKGGYSTLVSKPGQFRTTPRIGVRFGISTGKQARTQPSWLTAAVWSWAPRWPQ